MDSKVITPKLDLSVDRPKGVGKSVSISMRKSLFSSVRYSVYDSVSNSVRRPIDSSMWTPIRNLTTWEIKL